MFYTFTQNNSGGSWVFDPDRISHHVIIEADTSGDAIHKAESIGLYFDGVSGNMDCSCCGDRWSEPWEGTETPEVYGKSVAPGDKFPPSELIKWIKKRPEGYIHYKNGVVAPFRS